MDNKIKQLLKNMALSLAQFLVGAGLKLAFNQLDSNDDGVLDFEEISSMALGKIEEYKK